MTSEKQTTKVRVEDLDDLYQQCAGLDVHEASVTVCVVGGGKEGALAEFGTTTGELRQLGDWLRAQGAIQEALESTGGYWMPVWQILETGGFQLRLATAKEVRNLPGRKTDLADAIWLASLLRKGLVRASFVPSAEVRAVLDQCRSHTSLTHDRTRIVQRIEKILEQVNV